MKDKTKELHISSNPNIVFSTVSSKDRIKDFDATKQNTWLMYSEAVINELGNLFPFFPESPPIIHKDLRCPEELLSTQIGCTYAWLANKRREVAKILKHGPLRHQFGLINKPGFASTDEFNLCRDLPSQKNEIYAHIHELINKPAENIEVTEQKTEYEGKTRYIIRINLPADKRAKLHEKNMDSHFPFVEDDVALTITLHDYGRQDNRTTLVIDHCMTPFAENYTSRSSYFQVQFELIQPYFESCCNWRSTESIHDFLINAGKIAHALARLQPVGRGNSAIVEWMIRGLAKAKNIELGPFNHEELGWDFKAFLTPDSEIYAQWFAEKAFISPNLIANESILLGK
ncbi:hypothetical protein [Legionella longbeachae]|uniref:hypothetical protein n=1 Tax=Legionella longbeachae TaxID=450 RepID=UPI0012452FD7|nr:hypothetical protein [Legionella longbeachae]QEY52034.1 hypothetical protein FQU71_12800 [Legionella longbeachae]